jgi:hypothetical protein
VRLTNTNKVAEESLLLRLRDEYVIKYSTLKIRAVCSSGDNLDLYSAELTIIVSFFVGLFSL